MSENNTAARELLSAIMYAPPEVCLAVFDSLRPEDFANPHARKVYSAAYGTFVDKGKVDPYKVGDSIGNMPLVANLISAGTAPLTHIDVLVERVREEGMVHRLNSAMENATKAGDIQSRMKLLRDTLSDIEDTRTRYDFRPGVLLSGLEKAISEVKTRGYLGLRTPWPMLNELVGGLRPGHFWVIGGYTSSGKTTASVDLVARAMNDGRRCLYFSTEMDKVTLSARIAGQGMGVPTMQIMAGCLHEVEWEGVKAVYKTMDSFLTIYDDIYLIDDMRIKAMRNKAYWGELDLIVVDFVQNLMGPGEIYQKISDAAIKLQLLAKEVGACVVAMSQLPNDAVINREPVPRYKGGGELAAAADVGVMLRPVRKKEGCLWFDVWKHRHGPVGKVPLKFERRFTTLQETTPFREKASYEDEGEEP